MLQKELRKLILPLLAPGLLLYLVLELYPNVTAFYWAMTDYDGFAPNHTFVGFNNFIKMWADHRWWGAVQNSLFFAAGTLVTMLPLGLLFAVLITNLRRGQGFFKTVIYIPSVLSSVIVAFLWVFTLDSTIGLLNPVLRTIGLEEPLKHLLGVPSLNWLGSPKLAKPTIVVVQLWQGLGFYTLIFMAGLGRIPHELSDAAKIDGATDWNVFRYITWPLLFPTTQTVFLLLIIHGLQIFSLIFALTGGGVGTITQSMATYIYRSAFQDRMFGYATALSVFLMIFVMIFTLIAREATKRDAVQY